jgi:hypothetical protein
MRRLLQNRAAAAALAVALGMAGGAQSQPPVKIPSSTQEQVVNLELKVRDLQQALAQLQRQVSALQKGQGNTPPANNTASRVTAPFEVVNAAGKTLLTVGDVSGDTNLYLWDASGAPSAVISTVGSPSLSLTKFGAAKGEASKLVSLDSAVGLQYSSAGQTGLLNIEDGVMGFRLKKGGFEAPTNVSLDLTGGLGNLHLFNGTSQVGSLSVNAGGDGARLWLHQPSGTGSFVAGISANGDGYANAVAKSQAAISMGADGGGFVGLRAFAKWGGPPSGGISIQNDGSATVYAGMPGSMRAKMGINQNGQGIVNVVDDRDEPMAYLSLGPNGGMVAAANLDGTFVTTIGVSHDPMGHNEG